MTKIRVMGKHYELSVTAVCQNCCNRSTDFARPDVNCCYYVTGGRGCCQFSPMILSVSAITVPIIAFVFALLSILRSDYVTGAGRVTWIVVCFCFPLVGPIVWFIAGKSTALN